MVDTVNNLLQPQAQAAWRELSTGEQLRAATMLLDTVEQGAFVLADNLLKTDIVQENTDNIRVTKFTMLVLIQGALVLTAEDLRLRNEYEGHWINAFSLTGG
ncbi:adhesion G protein-coupled receptor L3 isoform X1 [Lates japonicus]|uniref:Adhesion G protein-coupled receptor L3 isoform X1 n=1 Tax=Lates japonicus TaxID=270547 RepID=A0AAD3R5H6_LATJO|nr:adhesion G protein-coupled receptor L3 isoform X1 [Lates japonicus]